MNDQMFFSALILDLCKICYPADPDTYRALTHTCALSEEDIYRIHARLAMDGIAPTKGPITSEELRPAR